MNAMVGSSILSNSFEAGVETARNSTKGLKNPKIGFLFTSTKYNQDELLKGIKSVCPELKIVGCTSSGAVMTPDGIISNEDGFAGMLVFEDNDLKIGVSSTSRGIDPRIAGRKVVREAMENAGKNCAPAAFALFASPREEEQYIKGVQDVIGEVPMFGGSASAEDMNGTWKVFDDNKAYEEGCAIALLYTNKRIKTVYDSNYKETDSMGIINKVDGERKILEIDGMPALKKYAQWNGLDPDALMGENLLKSSVLKPIAIKNVSANLTLVRHPKAGNDDYSLTVGAKVVEKTAAILMTSDIDGLIEGCVKNITRVKEGLVPAGLLLVHSVERKNIIDDRLDEDFVAIKNAAGDLPFIVAFTLSEYGHENHSGACVSNLSLSFTAISE